MTNTPPDKPRWEQLRDMAAAQYEADAKDETTIARAVTVTIDLSPFTLTPAQAHTIQNAANEYASWVAKNGKASEVDELFLRQRIECACEGMDGDVVERIVELVRTK